SRHDLIDFLALHSFRGYDLGQNGSRGAGRWNSFARLRLGASMNRHKLREALFVFALAIVLAPATSWAITYDAVNDFSITNGNPNGPWSYGRLSSLSGGSLTPLGFTQSNVFFPGSQDWWSGFGVPNSVTVTKNTSGTTQNIPGTGISVPPNEL